jgi:hypothetical protein
LALPLPPPLPPPHDRVVHQMLLVAAVAHPFMPPIVVLNQLFTFLPTPCLLLWSLLEALLRIAHVVLAVLHLLLREVEAQPLLLPSNPPPPRTWLLAQ